MSPAVSPEVREMAGAEALPRANGELVFEAPWQGRTLGLAVALVDALGVEWDVFRQHLIAAIGDQPDRPYYESFAAALEVFVVTQGLTTADELDRRASQIVER